MQALAAAVALATAAAGGVGCSSTKKSAPARLTIGYSNDMLGEIRSCGCAAHDFGGLGRRATFLKMVRDTTGDFLLLEGGDFFGTGLNYGKLKADLTLKAMALMGYQGVAVGETDLGFGVQYLVDRAHATGVPILAANIWDAKADTLIFPASRVVTMPSGLKVGIIGVTSRRLQLPPQVPPGTIKITPPIKALRDEVARLGNSVDLIAVVAHMLSGEAQRLAKAVPGVDIIVHGHGAHVMRRVQRYGDAFILQVSGEGRYMGIASAVLDDSHHRIRSLTTDVTGLTDRFQDDEAIAKLFKIYDLDIAARETSDVPAGVLEARHLPPQTQPYAGAEACQSCHASIYEQWAGTHHANAFHTLTQEGREHDRDCTPCHVTGFYKRGGFLNLKETPNLTNVQCEACHGNGHDHVQNPKVKTTQDARAVCRTCHTVDRSPDFDFDTYWARIRHRDNG